MKKRILTVLILLFSTAVTYAADDVKTKPDLYFLEISEVVDSYKLLPPPPSG